MAGLAMGLSAITRPSILVTLPFALWWLNSRRDSQGKQYVAIVVACAMAIIAPVTVRNALVGHDLVFIASQGGVNFFIGNNPSADGVHAVVPGTRADWWGGYDDTRRIAQAGRERVLKPSEISAFWYRRGVAFLFHEPRAAMRLYLRKICLMLGNAEPSNERQLYFQRKHSAVLSVLVVNFAFILASATAGLVVLRARARNDLRDGLLPLLLAVAYALGIVAFFVTSRYRLPVAMFLIPLSAAGCSEMIALARRRAWKRCIPAVLVGSLVAVGSLANPLRISQLADARGAYALGVDYYRDCNYHEAMNWLNQSVQDDSTYAPTWAMLGRACARTGRPEVAIIDLEKACALDSTFSDAFHWLGVVYQKAGNDTLAERAYRRAIALDGTRVETLTNLAGVCFRAGRRENARLLLERALAVDSTYANALYGIGLYWEFNGEYNRATDAYRRALPYVPARVALQRVEHH
jgi:tetratricopeptide (TPR) repeat protein